MEETMNKQVKVHINGRTFEVPEGISILEAARAQGISVPTLCHSTLLRPVENCRLCVVRVAGEKQYKAACSTLVAEGMEITTDSTDLWETRKLLLELLLDTHYGDCVAPCTLACPANVDIQGYLALIRHGEYRDAVRLIKEKIPMPSVIGRVCPHPCESACRRLLVDEAVGINHCKRFAADYERDSGEWILPRIPPSSGRRVAVIGGGPAGLSAAYYLRNLGHEATIFESREKLGGMLRYGIPEYRLPKAILDWEIDGILSLGISVKTGVHWGQDFTLDDLKRDGFDAIYLAIGAWGERKLGIVGEERPEVIGGVDFLEGITADRHKVDASGKRVVIVGGGNVAIDAARSALRLGAETVTILYRRSRKEMPASSEEIEAAQAEGVDIQFLAAPIRIFADSNAGVKLEFLRMELGTPDASGRRRPVPVEGSEKVLKLDLVISAIGQYPDLPSPDMDGVLSQLPLTRWSTFGGDPRSMHTGLEMIFAGGDAFRGPATVVEALADGRKAAYSLDRFFQTGEVQPEPLHFNIGKGDLQAIDREPFGVMKTISREAMPAQELQRRLVSFEEVEQGLGEEQAARESARCLVCGCSAAFDCRLRDLMNEFQVDWRDQPSKKVHYQRVAAVDNHPLIALDPNKCIRCERCYVACATFQCSDAITLKEWPRFNDRCVNCGLCVDLCPTGALMEKREGRTVERLDWKPTETHCVHCACGCLLELNVKGERLVWIGNGSHVPPGWASTCERGRFRTYDRFWFGERLLHPLARQKGKLQKISWEKALKQVIKGFADISKHRGGKAIGALASPRATNEGLYLLERWLRAGWRSHGLDFPGREAKEQLWSLMHESGSFRGVFQELAHLEQADAILLCGDDLSEVVPVVATMVRRAFTRRNVPLWQVASKPDGLTPFASIALHTSPENWHSIIDALGQADEGFHRIPERLVQEVKCETARRDGSRQAESAISADTWRALARGFSASSSPAILFPETLMQSKDTADTVKALMHLARLSDRPGAAVGAKLYPLALEVNSAGALLMGVSPTRLPGFAPLSDDRGRKRCSDLWQVPELSQKSWASLIKMLEKKQIKALFIQDAALLWERDAEYWDKLVRSVEFLVLQETMMSPAQNRAHVVLPMAAFGEQTGTVINLERRILGLRRAFAPQGESRSDWETLSQIMEVQGLPCPADLAAIHGEIEKAIPDLADLTIGGFEDA
jgi:formate dehydrogenase major subunit